MKGIFSLNSISRAVSASHLGQGQVATRLSAGVIDSRMSNKNLLVVPDGFSGSDINRPRAMSFAEFSFQEKVGVCQQLGNPVSAGGLLFLTYVDPSSRSVENKEVRELAISQTLNARSLLYSPGYMLKDELGKASIVLCELFSDLSPYDQQALGARLFGKEGLLSGKNPDALLTALTKVRDDGLHPDQSNGVTGVDRAVVIALMGDIGALFADTGATTGVEGRSQLQEDILRENLRSLIEKKGLSAPNEHVVSEVQRAGGSAVVGPLKKEERIRPPAEHILRTGIHNTGEEVDVRLGIVPGQRIVGTKWDVAHISNYRLLNTTEPLAGHMSGSPAEILQVWDMLRGDSHGAQYLGVQKNRDPNHWDPLADISLERQDQLLARAAGAAAFLIGLGYHSAVEVTEGVLLYMGQNLRKVLDEPTQDAAHLFGHGAATSLMNELIKGQSEVV